MSADRVAASGSSPTGAERDRTVFGKMPNGREVVSYGPGLWFVERGDQRDRISIHRAAKLCAGYDSREFLRGGERFAHFVRLEEARLRG